MYHAIVDYNGRDRDNYKNKMSIVCYSLNSILSKIEHYKGLGLRVYSLSKVDNISDTFDMLKAI